MLTHIFSHARRFGTSTTSELTVVGLFGIFVLLSFYYFYLEMRSFLRGPRRYIHSLWRVVTFALVFMCIALVGLTGYTVYITRTVFGEITASPDQGALQSVGFLLDQEKNFSGVIVVVMVSPCLVHPSSALSCIMQSCVSRQACMCKKHVRWGHVTERVSSFRAQIIRIYKFCSVSRSLSTLTRTLGKSAQPLALLVVLFLIAAFGFALGTTLILGQDSYQFYTTAWAWFTLLRAGFGDFDFNDWMVNRTLGPVLLVLWLLFANAFLLNIVVAVICESFVEVVMENKEQEEKGAMNLIDAVWDLGPIRK
jgi:hypothetical protein